MIKLAQQDFGFGPPRTKKTMAAFPDYGKGIVSQRWRNPDTSARNAAFGSGALGAALGLAISRALGAKQQGMMLGGLLGAVAGGVPGYRAGKQEAESENSRILFLRRRLGINEPGEYDALLRHPERPVATIQKSKKQKVRDILERESTKDEAIEAEQDKMLTEQKSAAPMLNKANLITALKYLGAGGAGYAAGSEGTSRLGGYNDDSQAKRISGMLGGMTGLGILGASRVPNPAIRQKLIMAALTGGIMGEVVPTAVKTMNTSSGAMKELASATSDNAQRNLGGTISDFVGSDTAKGLGVGAGVAGLGALATGMSRPKTDEEIAEGRSRAGMVGRDFLKYVIPALAAGGAIGSLGGN